MLHAEGLNCFHSAPRQSISAFHTEAGGIHRRDNCLSSQPGTSRSSRVPARRDVEGRTTATHSGAVSYWDLQAGDSVCVLLVGQSKRRFLSIPGRVPGVLCSGFYLELQTVPGEALGWDCSYCWWCWVLGHDLVPGTRGSSWVSLAHLRAPA